MQHGHENRICVHPTHQLDHILDHAHPVGPEKITEHDVGLHGNQMRRERMPRLGRRPSYQLRPGSLPSDPRVHAPGGPVHEERSGGSTERLLGPQGRSVDPPGRCLVLHSRTVFLRLRHLHCVPVRHALPPAGLDPAGGSGPFVGRALSAEDRGQRVGSLAGLADRLDGGNVRFVARDDDFDVYLLRPQPVPHEPGSDHGTC